MLLRSYIKSAVAVAGFVGCSVVLQATAAPVDVEIFASANSSSGGIALDSGIDLTSGDRLMSSVDDQDCWSAGSGDRVSNANGLDGLSPAPCQPTGNFGLHSQDGESFAFGALVGRIGTGDWFFLGTSFDEVVGESGRLFLAYWDSNAGDNTGSVLAQIDVNPGQSTGDVPEPGTIALLGALALMAARRKWSHR